MPALKKNPDRNSSRDVFNKMLQELEHGSPVDFQLPNWLKKRKPMHYTFIRRNVYLTKKVKKRIEDDGIFCSCSPSSGSSGLCGRDCHCGMLLSSCSASCKCGNSCMNTPFQHRKPRKLKLVKGFPLNLANLPNPLQWALWRNCQVSLLERLDAIIWRQTEKCGSGLVADEDIKQGEFVIEYVGEVIDDQTCEERLWKMKHRGETNFYLCEINRDMVIDATYKGNKSRFINHSCQPNTEMQKWRIDGETRIGIFAVRDIKRGEDLTYDYQFVQFGADQDCYCGAEGCRRKLGTKPPKLKTSSSDSSLKSNASEDYSNQGWDKGNLLPGQSHRGRMYFRNCIGKVVRILRPHEDRCYFGYITHFNSISREHTIVFEDRREMILDMSKEDWEFL